MAAAMKLFLNHVEEIQTILGSLFQWLAQLNDKINVYTLPEIKDKMAVARAH